MIKKEMIAMLLAGGQGSRLGVLTAKVAKPAVAFGGKYRIIDFPLSNCINSGIDTVGVLTQYQPLRLNTHIGIGIPWDLDRNEGGVTVLPPYERSDNSEWYTGTANAIFQNLDYMEQYNPDYVLILSGDHIYKMDYEIMLNFHKANKADITIACMPVPMEEASRHCIFCNILRRNDISPCINPPVFFIQVKLRNIVDQFHIRFPVGTQSSYILPVAIILVGKKSLPFVFTVRKDMLTKITVTLCFQCQQSFLQYRPAEYVNSHGSQITARLLRFLLEFPHTSLLIRHHNPESACFFHRNSTIRIMC